jgi:hypothetical protein
VRGQLLVRVCVLPYVCVCCEGEEGVSTIYHLKALVRFWFSLLSTLCGVQRAYRAQVVLLPPVQVQD